MKHYTKDIGTLVSIPNGDIAMIEGYHKTNGQYSVYFFAKVDGKKRRLFKPEELRFLNEQ